MGEGPRLGGSDGAGPLAEHVRDLLRREAGNDAQLEDLAVIGTEAIEGSAHLGVVTGAHEILVHVGRVDAISCRAVAAMASNAAEMFRRGAAGDAENPAIEAGGLPPEATDGGDGPRHRLADNVVRVGRPDTAGGVGPQAGMEGDVEGFPGGGVAASSSLGEGSFVVLVHGITDYMRGLA